MGGAGMCVIFIIHPDIASCILWQNIFLKCACVESIIDTCSAVYCIVWNKQSHYACSGRYTLVDCVALSIPKGSEARYSAVFMELNNSIGTWEEKL